MPAWFVVIDLLWVAKPIVFGIDARHYQRATSVWLAGGDPWSVSEGGIPFAAGPHTLLLYVPTSWLPLEVSTAFWMVLGAAASVWLVRRLTLPLWWVLFPPLTHAIWNGNPQTVMLALLVLGTAVAGGLAAALKLYALLPLAFHPRRLAVAAVILVVTLPLVPWQLYLDQGLGVGSHLATAWNGSAWRLPVAAAADAHRVVGAAAPRRGVVCAFRPSSPRPSSTTCRRRSPRSSGGRCSQRSSRCPCRS